MKIKSSKKQLKYTQQQIVDYLKNVSEFEKLMPRNLQKFEKTSNESFMFTLSGMPSIYLRLDTSNPKNIVLVSDGEKWDFKLKLVIENLEKAKYNKAYFDFQGKFTPLMTMMIKIPLTKLLEVMINKLSKTEIR